MEARGCELAAFVPYRDHAHPIRTEADAWRDIWRQRQAAGIPVTFEEYQELGAALTRELAKMDDDAIIAAIWPHLKKRTP